MTRILHIPSGVYLTFPVNDSLYFSSNFTEIIEKSTKASMPKDQLIQHIVYNTDSTCDFRRRNHLPKDIIESEFEVIDD